jgi:predicted nucleic acid-binding protein
VSPLHFLDTNILLYSISRHPAESAKRHRAIDLLERDDGALSVQVLQEFYVQATRITRPDPLPHDIAVGLLATWMRFRVQEITLSILTGALEIRAAHGFSYWDSAIIAAARGLGCRELYSEDMTHGREVEGVTIINPFR